jgi:hypothetical protein
VCCNGVYWGAVKFDAMDVRCVHICTCCVVEDDWFYDAVELLASE